MSDKYYMPLINGKAQSETSFGVNLLSFILATAILLLCKYLSIDDLTHLFIIYVVSLVSINISLEIMFYPETCVYTRWKIRRHIDWKRVFYKEVALLVTLAVIGFLYWLLPMFAYNDFKLIYFPFLKYLVPFMLITSVPYFCLMDKIDEEPNDVYYELGHSIIHLKKMRGFAFGNYVRSWLVKAFWLSLMQPAAVKDIKWFVNLIWSNDLNNPHEWFWRANSMCFFIDLAYTASGYLVNLKILNSHTRTAEPTLLGWLVAIMCYWPFWGVLFYPFFFRYEEMQWINYFRSGSAIWWTWFGMIIFLEFLYSMATVAAGFRFSNLTYRGLWNTGPYKYTKHPAYVFKNISWWLISIPFMAATPALAIKLSCLLLGNNIIYYMRAKTEERHLSHYPEYVEYALMMNQKSIFRGMAKIFPFLKYKPLKQEQRVF